MGYILIALLLLTSSRALATEDSLRKISPYDFFDLFEDLYDSPEQAEEALDHFDVLSFGKDLRLDELTELPGISASTAFRLGRADTLSWGLISGSLTSQESRIVSSYLTARDTKYFWSSRSRVQRDPNARDERGYNDGRTRGDEYKIYDRVMLSQYGLNAGFLQSKDAGEANTLDHVRGFLQLHEAQNIIGDLALETAIAGDYSLSFGSGLLFSSGGIQGKSNEVIDAVQPHVRGIKGYLSSSVGPGFRGFATKLSLDALTGTLFYSNRSYDAVISDDTITSIDIDGYHRTETDIAKRDAAHSSLIGASVCYDLTKPEHHLQLGATGYGEAFDMPVRTGGFTHNFSGKALSMLSQHGTYTDPSFSASYEIALSKQENTDALGGSLSFVYAPSHAWQLALNGRYLPHDFVSRHGSAFGESTDDAQNERGVYLGARYLTTKALTLSAYVDLSNTFVPPYLAENNFKTTDLLLLAEYDLTDDMMLRCRTRWKRKSDEERGEIIRMLGSRDQFNTRLEHDWQPNDEFRLRTRGEIVNVRYNDLGDVSSETGFLLTSSAKIGFSLINPELRITWFNTPSYDSRLYVYENDLPGASGLAMLYGAGMRYSLVLSVDLFENASIAGKYGITVYSKEREFGSGITERTGKTSSKLGLQIELQF